MKTAKKEYNKYGVSFAIVWNIFLISLIVITNLVENNPLFHIESAHWYDMPIIMSVWTLIWYWIGYSLRKEFLLQRAYYLETYKTLDQEKVCKLFRTHYLKRYAKILTVVSATAIPWYIIGYVRDEFVTRNFIVMGILFVLAVALFFLTRYLKKEEKKMELY